MDRRGIVFLTFALVLFATYPVANQHDHSDTWEIGKNGWSWVPVVLGVVYLILAFLSWLDHRHQVQIGAQPLGYDRNAGHVGGAARFRQTDTPASNTTD